MMLSCGFYIEWVEEGKWMDSKIINEKLNLIRGEIISKATNIDFALGWRLTDYFFPSTTEKLLIYIGIL